MNGFGAKSKIFATNQGVENKALFRCAIPVQHRSMKYGCAKVSKEGQSVDDQMCALRVAGARQVFRETASGLKINRSDLHASGWRE